MQNRYVGDIGDYLKLGILRALSPGYHLGVAWWLFPDESYNRDGRHIGYLGRPDLWRHFNPYLFDTLRVIVSSGRRSVRELEAAGVLPGATFASELIPIGEPIAQRQQGRHEWLRSKAVGGGRSVVPRSRQRTGARRFSPYGSQTRQERHDQRARTVREAGVVPDRVSPPISSQSWSSYRDSALGWIARSSIAIDCATGTRFGKMVEHVIDGDPRMPHPLPH